MDFLCSPQGQVRSKCCVWDVQHGSHQAPFPPFKHIKTSLQLLPFCESSGFLQTPLLMGYKGLWKGFVSSVYQEVTWFPPHHLFLLWQDHRSCGGGGVAQSGGLGGQGSVHCLPWPDGEVAAHFLSSSVESRIRAREQPKGRIKHTVCSSACVVLSLWDGWRVLYKQHHRSLCPQKDFWISDCASQHLFLYCSCCWKE